MGILRFNDIPDWQVAAGKEERLLHADPDDAGPVGRRRPAPVEHSATWIQLDPESGELVYGGEIAIEVYRGHDKLLPESVQQKLGMREIRGWLFQVRQSGPAARPESFARLEGKEILLSKLPHSRNYFIRRALKPCKHEKAAWRQVERAWDKHPEIAFADDRLDRLLQELSVTPFVSFKGCRAAWAVVPERFPVLGEERFHTDDDYTIAALAIPFDEAYALLKTHPAIQHALNLTDDGCLFDGYHTAADVNAAVRHGLPPPKGPVKRKVTQKLYDNRDELLRAACCSALCGREVPDVHDSVARSAVIFYHRFAYNLVDRETEPEARPRRVKTLPANAGVAVQTTELEVSEPFGEREATREYTARWRTLGYDAAVSEMTRLIEYVLRAAEESIDEQFVATLRPALAGWPPGWRPPEGLDEALRRLKCLR